MKAEQLNDLTCSKMQPDSQVKLQDKCYNLAISAFTIIHDKLLETHKSRFAGFD